MALSAFNSFFAGAGAGRFPKLNDRDDLWRVLVTLTARKAYRLARHETRLKRGGTDRAADFDLARVVGTEPSPEFAALVAEESRRLLDALPDDNLRAVAVMKMEGHDADAIAEHFGVTVRTAQRWLKTVRGLWKKESPA